MAGVTAQYVAHSFVNQYYVVLNKSPANIYKFYDESSLLSWPGSDGDVKPVTTLTGINDKIVSSNYTNWFVEVNNVYAQKSLEGGVIVAATGFLYTRDDVKKNFCQTLFLARQEDGFFILNDILHIFDLYELTTNNISHDDEQKEEAAFPMENSDASTVKCSDSPPTTDAVENGNVEEEDDLSKSKDTAATVVEEEDNLSESDTATTVAEEERDLSESKDTAATVAEEEDVLSESKDTAAAVADSACSFDSSESLSSHLAPASDDNSDVQNTDNLDPSDTKEAVENGNVKEENVLSVSEEETAAATVADSTSSDDSLESFCSVLEPTLDVKVEAPKITYASVLANGKAARIPSNADNPAVAPPPAIVSACVVLDPSKISTPSNVLPEAAPLSSEDYPKLPTRSNGGPSTKAAPLGTALPTAKVPAAVVVHPSKISTPSNVIPGAAPLPCNGYRKLPTHSIGGQNANAPPQATSAIYIGRLPIDIDRKGILNVVTKFGPVRKGYESIQIRRHKDGFCCGFVDFESADSARRAVEAHYIKFGEKVAYISYKRSSNRGKRTSIFR